MIVYSQSFHAFYRWKAKGELFLSNVRMVFVAKTPDADGLRAVDLPLVYIRGDRFNQPIFGCNNLSGECWPVCDAGGPSGSLPPLPYKCGPSQCTAGVCT